MQNSNFIVVVGTQHSYFSFAVRTHTHTKDIVLFRASPFIFLVFVTCRNFFASLWNASAHLRTQKKQWKLDLKYFLLCVCVLFSFPAFDCKQIFCQTLSTAKWGATIKRWIFLCVGRCVCVCVLLSTRNSSVIAYIYSL